MQYIFPVWFIKTVPWSVGENMELFTVVASCQVEKDGPMVNTIKHAGHAILQAGYGEENVHKPTKHVHVLI